MHKNVSYWEQNTFFQGIDLAVIGSGIVGLNAALAYKERFPNRKVVVLERGLLPAGASTKNAGFACFGSISELVDDMTLFGEDKMLELIQKRWAGLQRLRKRVGDDTMNYKGFGGYEIMLKEEKDTELYKNYIPFFNEKLRPILGAATVYEEEQNTQQFGFGQPMVIIKNKLEGQLHPGKMMQGLLRQATFAGIKVVNGCTIKQFEEVQNGVRLFTDEFEFTAQQLLIATNGFTPRLLPSMEVTPARNQVLITEPIPNLTLKGCFHYEQGYYYFRNVGNRILLGGARHLSKIAEQTDEFGFTSTIQDALLDFLKEIILPNQPFTIAQKWSGILGIGSTKTPIVRLLSERIGVAVRLGGMGVAIGTLVGEEGAALFNE